MVAAPLGALADTFAFCGSFAQLADHCQMLIRCAT
jgi:hypothetical protein